MLFGRRFHNRERCRPDSGTHQCPGRAEHEIPAPPPRPTRKSGRTREDAAAFTAWVRRLGVALLLGEGPHDGGEGLHPGRVGGARRLLLELRGEFDKVLKWVRQHMPPEDPWSWEK